MWPATLPLCLMLWGAWISAHPTDSIPAPDLSMMFQDFMIQFNKTYQNQEETHRRFKAFVQNLEVSRALQATELGTAQYGVTRFSDLTESEFAERFANSPGSVLSLPPTLRQSEKPYLGKKNRSCDWRKAGVVTAVKHQGETCRSCWAFAAVSNIEALWNIHRHSPRNLSVQEIVDCTYPRRGCEGGYAWDGLLTVFNSSGLSSSVLYPYVGKDQRCQKHKGRNVAKIDGYEILPRDEKFIAAIVASKGPITALLNQKFLQHYKKGVIRRSAQDCSPTYLDHVVVVVGFDEVKSRRGSWTGSYWIIQNSWGEPWGEKGYFRLYRGANVCGIAMYTATAMVKDSGGKEPVRCPP